MDATAPSDSESASARRRTHWIPIFLSIAAASVWLTTFIQRNPRILVSWHGFLHTAIANRFPGPFSVPENPFFAGEPLPYYWFHHYVASLVSRVFHIHPIYALQMITITGLMLLWVGAGAIGVHRFGSLRAGLLVGFLALAGVNPLGPAIAVGKSIVLGTRLLDVAPPRGPADTVFVTERQSADLMTHPLLGALYVTGDWRRGQNVNWYLDNSSRGIALGLLFPLLFAFLGPTASARRLFSMAAIAAAMTAFSPLIGLAAVGSLCGCAVAVALTNRIRHGVAGARMGSILALAGAAAIGAGIASPTYYHLFLVGGSGVELAPARATIDRAIALALNVIVLLPMAVAGSFQTSTRLRDQYRILVASACALLFVVPFISLPDDTEHNLANVGQCFLVVPAVASTLGRGRRSTQLFVAGLFLPMTIANIASYMGRPSLPVTFEATIMHRAPDDALEHLYRWARISTPPESVFIADPVTPVKMSGNVAELPAFTGRTQFVDRASYLTSPHKDFERRRNLATNLVQGLAMSDQDARYLAALHRPMYLLSHRADQPDLMGRLVHLYGVPVFRDTFVAVFDVTGAAADTGAAKP